MLWHPKDSLSLSLVGSTSSLANIDKVDHAQYPMFAKAVPYVVDLEPGDILFLPALWIHNVTTLDPCISLNVFWKNLPSGCYASHDLYGNRDLVAYEKASQSLQKGCDDLLSLPLQYRQMYGNMLKMEIDRTLGI